MQQWRLLDNGPADAYTNMALDEALLLAQVHGESTIPTLRFYSWAPTAISLGYAQKKEEVVNKQACQQAGIDIVRRTTGGRAVYHNQELTYCLVVQADNPLFASSIRESYATISRGLLAGLQLLGLEAQLVNHHQLRNNRGGKIQSNACFLAPSWYEITVDGKKLVGSAQRRLKGVILQQGSLPLQRQDDFDCWQLSATERASLKIQWEKKTTVLQDLIGSLPINRIKQALIAGFEQALPIKLAASELTPGEKQLTKNLLAKYQSSEWNEQRAG